MGFADKVSCDLLINPTDSKYDEDIRKFQGCPTIAITKGGRIFLAWYAGGICEPHMENYNLLIYSDDDGKTWSKPALVIPSNKEKFIHALDIQLWISPKDELYVFWVQNNTSLAPEEKPEFESSQPGAIIDGYLFDDFAHSEWVTVCANPDADELQFSEPRCLDIGFLRCKPLVLENGDWINFNYDQLKDSYGYSISTDEGKTYTRFYGPKKLHTQFDETMAYQKKDGSIRMLARTTIGELAECTSFDNGRTWTEAKTSGIDSPNTRFFIARTPSGRILLVNNDDRKDRKNMTLYLSEDDGETWKYKYCIDTRIHLSYPDVAFYNGKIYLTYDRERLGEGAAMEIMLLSFTEENIINKNPIDINIVSKPKKA